MSNDQLLALALAHEAKHSMPLEPVALDVLVHEAIMRYLARADAVGVDLGARGVDHPVWVQGQAALMEGVLSNLLDNALRYGVAQDEPAHITVSVTESPHAVTLTVSDNGPGVSAAQLVQSAASLEAGSSHPLAQAIVGHARSRECAIATVTDVEQVPGRGMRARMNGSSIAVGHIDITGQRLGAG